MRRFLSKLVFTAALCVTTAAFAQAPKPGTSPDAPAARSQADELFDQAAAAFHAGRYAEAVQKLEQVWSLKQAYDVAGNLGVAEVKVGRYAQGAQHLSWALQHFPVTEPAKARRGFEQELVKARAEVGARTIDVSVADAEVFVDGKSVGVAPLADEVFLVPGTHTIEARRAEYETASQSIDVAKGSSGKVTLGLVHVVAVRRSVVPGAVLGGVAGAALVAGIGVFAAGRAKGATVDTETSAILTAGKSCVTGAANFDTRCPGLQSTASTANTFEKVGVGLMVGAGAAAVGAVIYFIVPTSGAGAKTGQLRLSPSMSSNGGGLAFSGAF
jgi:hypothetical protein